MELSVLLFEGKTTLQRQRLIYKSIWDLMESNAVHAVDSIVAKTPGELATYNTFTH